MLSTELSSSSLRLSVVLFVVSSSATLSNLTFSLRSVLISFSNSSIVASESAGMGDVGESWGNSGKLLVSFFFAFASLVSRTIVFQNVSAAKYGASAHCSQNIEP
eukprot:Pompholyxophrys_punicea_v1_NODE_439_length_1971_cov_8.485908.p2 type:complete len:105 gc:universal NODE_439_length_1971_cov_8.485908:456-142(-)